MAHNSSPSLPSLPPASPPSATKNLRRRAARPAAANLFVPPRWSNVCGPASGPPTMALRCLCLRLLSSSMLLWFCPRPHRVTFATHGSWRRHGEPPTANYGFRSCYRFGAPDLPTSGSVRHQSSADMLKCLVVDLKCA